MVQVPKGGTAEEKIGRTCLLLTNKFRKQQGLIPLLWEDALYKVALQHSHSTCRVPLRSHISNGSPLCRYGAGTSGVWPRRFPAAYAGGTLPARVHGRECSVLARSSRGSGYCGKRVDTFTRPQEEPAVLVRPSMRHCRLSKRKRKALSHPTLLRLISPCLCST